MPRGFCTRQAPCRKPLMTKLGYDELGVSLKLRDESGQDLWKSLDDGSDIAAISPPSEIGSKSPHAIFVGDFATDTNLYQGAAVFVLGYPGIVGNQYLLRPIVRQA